MRLVSPVLKRMVYPILSRIGYLHRYAERSQLSVVTYHGVLPAGYRIMDLQLDGSWVTPDGFRRQLRLLRSGYNVVSPSQVRLWCKGEGSLPRRVMACTTRTATHSRTYGIVATLFVSSRMTGLNVRRETPTASLRPLRGIVSCRIQFGPSCRDKRSVPTKQLQTRFQSGSRQLGNCP